jgi:hypothetical protein
MIPKAPGVQFSGARSNWRKEYNELRPHSSIGNLTPKEFLESLGREEDEPVLGSLEELIETVSSGFY